MDSSSPSGDGPAGRPALLYPVLLADIGGTNARFGLLAEPEADLSVIGVVQTADHAGFEAAARHVLANHTERPRSLLLAFAGPITDGPMALTNCPWIIDPASIVRHLQAERVVCLNDFEALSLCLPYLPSTGVSQIGDPLPLGAGSKVVLGPGTGLGVCGLAATRRGWQSRPAEAGHVGFGPTGADQRAIWPVLERSVDLVTAEHVLSGPGLLRLHQALAECRAGSAAALDDPAAVTALAEAGDRTAQDSIALFMALFARFSRDMALTFMAEGGVYLAGGVAVRLAHAIVADAFRREFEAGPVHVDLLRRIPVCLVTDPFPAFLGLSELARQPSRFDFDFVGRTTVGGQPA
ncbi:MAG: glucokinase [Pseudomonadota bacterium]